MRSGAIVLICALRLHPLSAQSPFGHEMSAGGEWEMYARVLSVHGVLVDDAWSIRPVGPGTRERWSSALALAHSRHPWKGRTTRRDSTGHPGRVTFLRPAMTVSFNSEFPWGMHDGAVWQGKGTNAWLTFGGAFRRGGFSARVEPLFQHGANRAFELAPINGSPPNPFLDAAQGFQIDLPQRLGEGAFTIARAGQSYLRYDRGIFGVALSTENLFWGPSYRNSVVLGADAPGFPHLRLGSSEPVRTRFGRLHGTLLYGRLPQSEWAPPSQQELRLGSGLVAVWMPPTASLELGVARFMHTRWPRRLSFEDLLVPFNFLIGHDSTQQTGEVRTGKTTNELASAFFRVRAARGLEIFGEFGRNDRPEDLRDLAVELEHNSAWSLGGLATWQPDSMNSVWSLRMEYLNGRIASINRIGRGQATFYVHAPWTQGHTAGGQLLGSPLMERASGAEVALDRWASWGRAGVLLIERQMPEDALEGMRHSAARTQWDVGINGILFLDRGDLSFGAGRVLDLNRFPGRSIPNLYARLGWQASFQ